MAVRSVMVLCGGPSTEHEISLISASGIVSQLQSTFDVHVVGITREGQWLYFKPGTAFASGVPDPRVTKLLAGEPCHWVAEPGRGLQKGSSFVNADVYFPLIHGNLGEDGKLQALFELADVAYVGCGVDASAAGFNKEFTKRILENGGVPVVEFVAVHARQKWADVQKTLDPFVQRYGTPLFVKPASQGSSIGVRKVSTPEELKEALREALTLDPMVLVERAVAGRELEISVLGNEVLEVSLPGEVHVEKDTFYTYDAKYVYPDRVRFSLPAKLDPDVMLQMKEMATRTFQLLNCQGMARIDFLWDQKNKKLYVNEINTIPGFTPISMYPKMFAASGVDYMTLLQRLLSLAVESHQQRRARTRAALTWRP